MIGLLPALALAGRPQPLPAPLPPVAFTAPTAVRRTLSNGIPVLVIQNTEVPVYDIRLVLKVGRHADPEGVDGLASITFDLLDEGAGTRDAAELAAAVKALGAELSTGTSGDTASIEIRGITRNLPAALDLWRDVIRSPRLAEADLAIVRERQIQRVVLQLQQPEALADRVGAHLVYGDAYLGRSPTEASLRAITIGHVHALWSKRVGPEVAAIVAGGDIDPDALVALLEARIGDWRPDVEPVPVDPTARTDVAGTIHVVDLPGAPQSAIRAFAPSATAADPIRFPLEVGVEVLGGAFSSRLNLNLREDKGWTYGARCYAIWPAGTGRLSCSALVRADATAGGVRELRAELAGISGDRPITPEETATFRDALLRAWPLQHETTGSLLSEQVTIWNRGLPDDWTARWLAGVGAVTPDSAGQAMRTVADPARAAFLVVGDLAKVRTELEALGMPLVELPRE